MMKLISKKAIRMPVTLFHGDCRPVLAGLPENSIDSIVTDPPYGLSKHATDDIEKCLSAWLAGQKYDHHSPGFMSNEWDSFVPGPEVWRECLRVLKPGGHILCFAGTRSMDLMSIAIRLAGFELRDAIGVAQGSAAPLMAWVHSQGMPHGKNIGKEAKTVVGLPNTLKGWNTALKPAWEPILMARKPIEGTLLENALRWGTGGLNIDACRVPVDSEVDAAQMRTMSRGQRTNDTSGQTWGFSKLGADTPQVVRPEGRFPANVIHDGSADVEAAFSAFGQKTSGTPGKRRKQHETVSMGKLNIMDREEIGYADSGSASRFFYCAKASTKDKDGSQHPTVKPLALMRYLCRLVCPKGGVVLDPYAGSGTTGQAAVEEGFNAILIEKKDQYIADCQHRLALYLDGDVRKIV